MIAKRFPGSLRLALLAAALAAPAAGFAADIDPSYLEAGQTTPVEYGSGWYLRGDIGTFHASGEASYGVGGSGDVNGAEWFSDASFSAGAGYILNQHFRADVTLNYRDGINFEGTSDFYECGGAYTGECATSDVAEGNSTSIEANAYWNIAHIGGFSPYVGAGAGIAFVNWDDVYLQRCRLDQDEDCVLANNGAAVTQTFVGTETQTRSFDTNVLTLSASAGFDYRFAERWVADFGYKYTHMLDIGMNDDQTLPNLDSVSIHEIRAGLRYEIW